MAKKANVTIKRLRPCIKDSDENDFEVTFEIIDRQLFNGTECGCIFDDNRPQHCKGFDLKFTKIYRKLFEFLSNHINGKFEIEYDYEDIGKLSGDEKPNGKEAKKDDKKELHLQKVTLLNG